MLEANVNANKLFSAHAKSQNEPLLIAIEQFNKQIHFLRARLASELSINSLLMERAQQQLPNHQILDSSTLAQTHPFSNYQIGKDERYPIVKKQESLFSYYQDGSILEKQLLKINSKQKQNLQEELASCKKKIKVEMKIEEKSQNQSQQNNEKNETKNIPKNYGKAMLSFIQKNIQKYVSVVKPILQRQKLTVSDLLNHIKKHKKEVNSIHYLKLMWGFQNINDPIFKCIRILSHVFMRKYCLYYIFNSRIKNFNTHIKYRKRILEGIENPVQFTCIKQF